MTTNEQYGTTVPWPLITWEPEIGDPYNILAARIHPRLIAQTRTNHCSLRNEL